MQQITIIDDTDGSRNASTVTFMLDGQQYEIDLSPRNMARFRKMVSGWTAYAHKAGKAARPVNHAAANGAGQHRVRSAVSRRTSREIRAWAMSPAGQAAVPGKTVSARGRIPAEYVTAYENRNRSAEPANGSESPAPAPATFRQPTGPAEPAADGSAPRSGKRGNGHGSGSGRTRRK